MLELLNSVSAGHDQVWLQTLGGEPFTLQLSSDQAAQLACLLSGHHGQHQAAQIDLGEHQAPLQITWGEQVDVRLGAIELMQFPNTPVHAAFIAQALSAPVRRPARGVRHWNGRSVIRLSGDHHLQTSAPAANLRTLILSPELREYWIPGVLRGEHGGVVLAVQSVGTGPRGEIFLTAADLPFLQEDW